MITFNRGAVTMKITPKPFSKCTHAGHQLESLCYFYNSGLGEQEITPSAHLFPSTGPTPFDIRHHAHISLVLRGALVNCVPSSLQSSPCQGLDLQTSCSFPGTQKFPVVAKVRLSCGLYLRRTSLCGDWTADRRVAHSQYKNSILLTISVKAWGECGFLSTRWPPDSLSLGSLQIATDIAQVVRVKTTLQQFSVSWLSQGWGEQRSNSTYTLFFCTPGSSRGLSDRSLLSSLGFPLGPWPIFYSLIYFLRKTDIQHH